MEKEKTGNEDFSCPIGRLFDDFEKKFGKDSEFFDHLSKSAVEFLKGIRSLLDDSIERMEKRGTGKPGKRATKIKVE